VIQSGFDVSIDFMYTDSRAKLPFDRAAATYLFPLPRVTPVCTTDEIILETKRFRIFHVGDDGDSNSDNLIAMRIDANASLFLTILIPQRAR
jgi:hypothetical protein